MRTSSGTAATVRMCGLNNNNNHNNNNNDDINDSNNNIQQTHTSIHFYIFFIF